MKLIFPLLFLWISVAHAKSVPGEFIIKLEKQADIGEFKKNSSFNIELTRLVNKERRTYLVKLPELIYQEDYILQQLLMDESIEIAEPNIIYSIRKEPNDLDLGKLWGHYNYGQEVETKKGVAGIDIDALKAWDLQTGDRKVVIAVIDTGVEYTHEDLKNNLWTNTKELKGKPGVDDDNNGYIDDIYGYDFVNNDGDPMDDNKHGTHCAGIIGAQGNNALGIVGVNWNTSIMSVKFLNDFGSGTLENAIKAIDYAVAQKARILNNSWSGDRPSELLKEAIAASEKKDILFVAAAGNSQSNNDSTPRYPASYSNKNIISVAAINSRGELARFSNYGRSSVDIAAPGVDIYSTVLKNSYDFLSGTSMATPYVAGIAGLLLSTEESLGAKKLIDRIIKYSSPHFKLKRKVASGGLANAYYSLAQVDPPEDDQDPARLKKFFPWKVSTPHPYEALKEYRFSVKVPGAKEISIHFNQFVTEVYYDVLEIIDLKTKTTLASLSGEEGLDYKTSIFKTNEIELVFKTDSYAEYFGFEINGIYYE